MLTALNLKRNTPPPLISTKWLKTFIMFAFGLNLSAQTPTTFTTNNLKVMDTLTSINVVNAHEIVASKTITAEKDIVVKKDVLVNGALTVTNTATFKNIINADQGLNFGNNIGLKYLGTNASNQSFLQIGKIPSTSLAIPANPICPSSQTNQYWLQNYGGYISNAINGNVNASLSFFTADWNGSGYIETSGTDQNNQTINALFLNYFCGRDIGLCLNTTLANGGGKVKVGNFLSATKHVEIGDTAGYSTNDPSNIALEINTFSGIGAQVKSFGAPALPAYCVKINSNTYPFIVYGDGRTTIKTNNTEAFKIIDNTTNNAFLINNDGKTTIKTSNQYAFTVLDSINTNVFTVKRNGITQIGKTKPIAASVHGDAKLSVDGKILAKSFYVTLNTSIWADYVFEKNYKKIKLNDLETFVFTKKHLPNMPTAKQVNENGINLSETTVRLLEKLEEAYLHIFDLNKRIEKLEAKNN